MHLKVTKVSKGGNNILSITCDDIYMAVVVRESNYVQIYMPVSPRELIIALHIDVLIL